MVNLTSKNKGQINKLRNLLPAEISVKIIRSQDGGFSAEIFNFTGPILTEGDTFAELIEMINDAIYTYFEIPGKYLSFMPTYLPTVETAKNFDAFPNFKMEDRLKLKLPVHEAAHS